MTASPVVRFALILAALVGTAPAQLLADADQDVIRTLARGMVHRESQVGPLTGCLMLVKTLGEGHRVLERAFPPEFRLPEVEPGVVALAFRETDDLRWELHAQVITPGYNEWIRTVSARDRERGGVSDLYSVTVSDGARLYEMTRGQPTPVLNRVAPLSPGDVPLRRSHEVGRLLGLTFGARSYGAILSHLAGVSPEEPARGAPRLVTRSVTLERENRHLYRVCITAEETASGGVHSITLWVDASIYAVRDYREVGGNPARPGAGGIHVRYRDFRPLEELNDDVILPHQSISWQYLVDDEEGGEPQLVSVEVCEATRLVETTSDPTAFPLWLPVGAFVPFDVGVDTPELAGLAERLYGNVRSTAVMDMASGAHPFPEAPEDFLADLRKAASGVAEVE